MATAARARGRTVRAAVATAIQAARDAGRLQPWHEPAAALALTVAAALGRKDVPAGELVRLSSELQKLLSGLPLAPETAPKGADGDGPAVAAGGAGAGVSRPLGLASGVGAGPEVGDTALPA